MFFKNIVFLSLMIHFVLVNSEDTDEMLHNAKYRFRGKDNLSLPQ